MTSGEAPDDFWSLPRLRQAELMAAVADELLAIGGAQLAARWPGLRKAREMLQLGLDDPAALEDPENAQAFIEATRNRVLGLYGGAGSFYDYIGGTTGEQQRRFATLQETLLAMAGSLSPEEGARGR